MRLLPLLVMELPGVCCLTSPPFDGASLQHLASSSFRETDHRLSFGCRTGRAQGSLGYPGAARKFNSSPGAGKFSPSGGSGRFLADFFFEPPLGRRGGRGLGNSKRMRAVVDL